MLKEKDFLGENFVHAFFILFLFWALFQVLLLRIYDLRKKSGTLRLVKCQTMTWFGTAQEKWEEKFDKTLGVWQFQKVDAWMQMAYFEAHSAMCHKIQTSLRNQAKKWRRKCQEEKCKVNVF